MNYYQDLTLVDNTEVSLGYIWQKVFQQVHIALADNKLPNGTSDIAISIPDYKQPDLKENGFPLGNKLRLLAESQEKLEQLSIEKWLKRLSDYCHIASIRTVPQNTSFACFRREQAKSIENKAKRRAKKLDITYEEALSYFKKNNMTIELCDLPFIQVESQSTRKGISKNKFSLFIRKVEKDSEAKGVYDCYGLSKTATVPIF